MMNFPSFLSFRQTSCSNTGRGNTFKKLKKFVNFFKNLQSIKFFLMQFTYLLKKYIYIPPLYLWSILEWGVYCILGLYLSDSKHTVRIYLCFEGYFFFLQLSYEFIWCKKYLEMFDENFFQQMELLSIITIEILRKYYTFYKDKISCSFITHFSFQL